MAVQIQMRRGTLSQWATANPTLADGEWGLETDTDKFKIGNGTDAWNSITTYSSLGVGTAGGTFAGTINFGADGTGQDVNFYSGTAGDHMKWDASEEQLIIEGTNGTVALHVTDGDVTIADGDLIVSGDLTINGATTTISTTNTVVEDRLIELANGASGSSTADAGIVIERGSDANQFIGWDESVNKFTVGETSATGASTGNLSITAGTLVADLEGDVTGSVTGAASLNLLKAGDTLSGEIVAADQIISAPIMKDYAETVYAGGNTSTSVTLALTNGNVQTWTMTGNCTFTMPSGSTLQAGSSLTLILTQDGTGSRTGAYTGVKWAGGTVPTLTITATTGIDILTFTTFNGGASPVWHGFAAGLAMA
jgi:hypothetical protein